MGREAISIRLVVAVDGMLLVVAAGESRAEEHRVGRITSPVDLTTNAIL